MNDFLHSLRNNNHNSNHNQKRYERPRRHYDNQQYGNNDRKSGNYRSHHHKNNADTETLNAIRKTLETIADGQQAMVDLGERRAQAEERKAAAIENIAEHVINWLSQLPATGFGHPGGAAHKSAAGTVVLDPRRQALVDKVKGLRAEGLSYEKIAQQLENENVPTLSGRGRWRGQTIHRLCNGTAFSAQNQ